MTACDLEQVDIARDYARIVLRLPNDIDQSLRNHASDLKGVLSSGWTDCTNTTNLAKIIYITVTFAHQEINNHLVICEYDKITTFVLRVLSDCVNCTTSNANDYGTNVECEQHNYDVQLHAQTRAIGTIENIALNVNAVRETTVCPFYVDVYDVSVGIID